MKRRILISLLCVMSVLALTLGCRQGAPIQNTANTVPQNQMTQTDMRDAILRGGKEAGWTMAENTPGKITATLVQRKHQAVVDIPYDAKGYQINYVSSVNLKAKDGTIHPNYNKWVNRLNDIISTEIAKARP